MTNTLKHLRLASVIGLLLLPVSHVQAHDAASGPNGGTMVLVDDKHLELAKTGEALTVYVTDAKHDTVSTVGGTGRAIMQADGKTATMVLVPSAPNGLTGKTDAPLSKGTRVVITATLHDGTNVQARFVIP
jgi:hypothetical protein